MQPADDESPEERSRALQEELQQKIHAIGVAMNSGQDPKSEEFERLAIRDRSKMYAARQGLLGTLESLLRATRDPQCTHEIMDQVEDALDQIDDEERALAESLGVSRMGLVGPVPEEKHQETPPTAPQGTTLGQRRDSDIAILKQEISELQRALDLQEASSTSAAHWEELITELNVLLCTLQDEVTEGVPDHMSCVEQVEEEFAEIMAKLRTARMGTPHHANPEPSSSNANSNSGAATKKTDPPTDYSDSDTELKRYKAEREARKASLQKDLAELAGIQDQLRAGSRPDAHAQHTESEQEDSHMSTDDDGTLYTDKPKKRRQRKQDNPTPAPRGPGLPPLAGKARPPAQRAEEPEPAPVSNQQPVADMDIWRKKLEAYIQDMEEMDSLEKSGLTAPEEPSIDSIAPVPQEEPAKPDTGLQESCCGVAVAAAVALARVCAESAAETARITAVHATAAAVAVCSIGSAAEAAALVAARTTMVAQSAAACAALVTFAALIPEPVFHCQATALTQYVARTHPVSRTHVTPQTPKALQPLTLEPEAAPKEPAPVTTNTTTSAATPTLPPIAEARPEAPPAWPSPLAGQWPMGPSVPPYPEAVPQPGPPFMPFSMPYFGYPPPFYMPYANPVFGANPASANAAAYAAALVEQQRALFMAYGLLPPSANLPPAPVEQLARSPTKFQSPTPQKFTFGSLPETAPSSHLPAHSPDDFAPRPLTVAEACARQCENPPAPVDADHHERERLKLIESWMHNDSVQDLTETKPSSPSKSREVSAQTTQTTQPTPAQPEVALGQLKPTETAEHPTAEQHPCVQPAPTQPTTLPPTAPSRASTPRTRPKSGSVGSGAGSVVGQKASDVAAAARRAGRQSKLTKEAEKLLEETKEKDDQEGGEEKWADDQRNRRYRKKVPAKAKKYITDEEETNGEPSPIGMVDENNNWRLFEMDRREQEVEERAQILRVREEDLEWREHQFKNLLHLWERSSQTDFLRMLQRQRNGGGPRPRSSLASAPAYQNASFTREESRLTESRYDDRAPPASVHQLLADFQLESMDSPPSRHGDGKFDMYRPPAATRAVRRGQGGSLVSRIAQHIRKAQQELANRSDDQVVQRTLEERDLRRKVELAGAATRPRQTRTNRNRRYWWSGEHPLHTSL
eukprot:TRINITY_DN7459_c0_g2_i1.p1 TRINITY_DN7459_c0_g2~~TRINITY_DN7459_c0_g2_i1.p1  ORF type:complete len:1145 (-),score=179.94 TRINITY_DN7459_c0_g2_i1:53-3487(-)